MRKCLAFAWIAFVLSAVTVVGASAQTGGPPSTDGWAYDVESSAGNVVLTLRIDNLQHLQAWKGDPISKTWGDPAEENMEKWIQLGNGALMQYLTMGLAVDPQVFLDFNVAAGPAGTNFTITSVLLSFPAILAQGTATAAMTATDRGSDGATATGLLGGGKMYEAYYNAGTLFTGLVGGPLVAPAFGSNSANETKPPWTALGVVSDMQAAWSFHLSANDSASGTSSYTIVLVPEPAPVIAVLTGLVGLTGLVMRRRSY